jgi:hypothetical protein
MDSQVWPTAIPAQSSPFRAPGLPLLLNRVEREPRIKKEG